MVPYEDVKHIKIDNRFVHKRKIRVSVWILTLLKSQWMSLNFYDTFSFFDIDGEWNLNTTNFLVGLRKLYIDTSGLTKDLAVSNNGSEAIQCLWLPGLSNVLFKIELFSFFSI